jgi:hypothetical protein
MWGCIIRNQNCAVIIDIACNNRRKNCSYYESTNECRYRSRHISSREGARKAHASSVQSALKKYPCTYGESLSCVSVGRASMSSVPHHHVVCMSLNPTSIDSTLQHKLRHYTTGQHRTAQDSTGQHRTPQDTTGHHRTPQDTTGHHRTPQATTPHHSTAQDSTRPQDTTLRAPHHTTLHYTAARTRGLDVKSV